ncbi:MAG: epoxyqueuosine reductase QueH [Candidatus Berkelbacteria bacterium]
MNYKKKQLLLHACCAPCLTSSEMQTHTKYEVIPFWYNPNIEPVEEHDKRQKEYLRFINSKSYQDSSEYDYLLENIAWHKAVDEMKNEPEGGKRCQRCIEFRLKRAAEFARQNNIELFSTTLSVSPHKNKQAIDAAGTKHANMKCEYVAFDFKKDNGYRLSIELSKELNLYRQNYCGCAFSIRTKK